MTLMTVVATLAWCNGAAFAGPAMSSKAQPTVGNLKDLDEEDLRFLRQNSRVLEDKEYEEATYKASSSSKSYAMGTNFFAKTNNVYYDGYQQAWRYLGHLVKCGYPSSRYNQQNSHSHSGDNNNKWSGNNYCQRYLVWAAVSSILHQDDGVMMPRCTEVGDFRVFLLTKLCFVCFSFYLRMLTQYVDLNYKGGGIGEYYYQDAYSGEWDYTGCDTHPSSSGRCAPMDCHFSNTTTWTLMGVYKEAEYFGNNAFFEQLFKHEGVCVWNDDDLYSFMSTARQNYWPEGCVQTNSYVKDSDTGYYSYLYLDLKPTYNGNMTYGLYTDEVCKYEYKGSQVTVAYVAQSMGLLYGSNLYQWNEALEVYKVCQPCMAYNLKNAYQSDDYVSNNYYYGGNDNYYNYRRERRTKGYLDYASSDPNEGYFQCNDDAGYLNVNQCMKFRSHADLEVAGWEDLVIATEQGGILEVNVGGTIFGTGRMTYEEQQYKEQLRQEDAEYLALVASVPSTKTFTAVGFACAVLGPLSLVGAIAWVVCRGRAQRQRRMVTSTQKNLKEPLVSPYS
jgi:hypothetical protein